MYTKLPLFIYLCLKTHADKSTSIEKKTSEDFCTHITTLTLVSPTMKYVCKFPHIHMDVEKSKLSQLTHCALEIL